MKNIKRNCLGIYFVLSVTSFCFSQEVNVAEEAITLPDVSTVISDGAIKAGKSAVPDYSEVLPKTEIDAELLPQLPDSENIAVEEEKVEMLKATSEKDVYAEGIAGCGLPGFFIGNFSVYRQSGNNPFKISFMHEGASGYARNALTAGYFDRNTEISAEKTFTTNTMKFYMAGSYKTLADGMQNKVENISDVTKEIMSASFLYDWKLPKGFGINSKIEGDWYKRFACVVGEPVTPILDYGKDISTLEFVPQLGFSWEYKGFYTNLGGKYSLFNNLNNSFVERDIINRGDFSLALGWKHDFINVYGNANVVVGNEIGNESALFPFTVGADFSFVTGLSSRNMNISLSGGLDSYSLSAKDLELAYKFTALSFMPSETTDWFGKLVLGIPVKEMFTINFDGVFKMTAFDNGTWQPNYNSETTLYGQYAFEQKDMIQVNTTTSVSFRVGIATISALWKACWGDVAALNYQNYIGAVVSVQDENSRFGIDASFGMPTDSNADIIPIIDMSAFFRLTQAVRLAVSVEDIVKLISGDSRTYAGDYIDRSGSAAILVKFFF